jgi:hypothetical protein
MEKLLGDADRESVIQVINLNKDSRLIEKPFIKNSEHSRYIKKTISLEINSKFREINVLGTVLFTLLI